MPLTDPAVVEDIARKALAVPTPSSLTVTDGAGRNAVGGPAGPDYRVTGVMSMDARTPEARFVIVEDEAGVVRRIIRERAAGTACHVVAAGLQADTVPSPSGTGRWTASRLSGIATNPAYRGVIRWREDAGEISVPRAIPVISDDTVASWDGKRWRLPHPPACGT